MYYSYILMLLLFSLLETLYFIIYLIKGLICIKVLLFKY
jgi:hypothetical protein